MMADVTAALVGVVGDFNPKNRNHLLTSGAIEHLGLRVEWVPTDVVGDEPEKQLAAYDGQLIGFFETGSTAAMGFSNGWPTSRGAFFPATSRTRRSVQPT